MEEMIKEARKCRHNVIFDTVHGAIALRERKGKCF